MSRIIASVLFDRNSAYFSKNFLPYAYIGELSNILRIWSLQSIDEIILINASDDKLDNSFFENIKKNIAHAFVPIGYIGNINSFAEASEIISMGIEKIGVPFSKRNEEWLQEFTSKYGKQALFVSYDVYDELNNQDLVNISGLRKTFGEVIINNVVRNGQNLGINWEIISELEKVEKITIIYSGGTAKPDIEKIKNRKTKISIMASRLFSMRGNNPYPLANIDENLRRSVNYEMLSKLFNG